MRADRIGEILSRIISLSTHDIEEILQEQRATHRPFGDIALAMGLCRPEDIWQAWSGQLDSPDGRPQRVDLDLVGVDAQAVEFMTAEAASRHSAIPVRVFGDELVIAIDASAEPSARSTISVRQGLRVKFVFADRGQIHRAIETYYGLSQASAA